MKLLTILLSIMLFALPMEATSKNKKRYIERNELFMFSHGMYIACPGNLYRVRSVYFSKKNGYFTYKNEMRKIPLNKMSGKNWDGHSAINRRSSDE